MEAFAEDSSSDSRKLERDMTFDERLEILCAYRERRLIDYDEKFTRVVVKVGTSTLTMDNGGGINEVITRNLIEEMVAMKRAGFGVIFVTSGAVGIGKVDNPGMAGELEELLAELEDGIKRRQEEIAKWARVRILRQKLACMGQVDLMNHYSRLLSEHDGFKAGQGLYIPDDFKYGSGTRKAMSDPLIEMAHEENRLFVANGNDLTSRKHGDNVYTTRMIGQLLHSHQVHYLTNVAGYMRVLGDLSTLERHMSRSSNNASDYDFENPSPNGIGGMRSMVTSGFDIEGKGNEDIEVIIADGRKQGVVTAILTNPEFDCTRIGK